jgi:hypothetical protein
MPSQFSRNLGRLIGILLLLVLAGFCIFGFVATLEPLENGPPLAFRWGYAALGLLALAGVGWLARRR